MRGWFISLFRSLGVFSKYQRHDSPLRLRPRLEALESRRVLTSAIAAWDAEGSTAALGQVTVMLPDDGQYAWDGAQVSGLDRDGTKLLSDVDALYWTNIAEADDGEGYGWCCTESSGSGSGDGSGSGTTDSSGSGSGDGSGSGGTESSGSGSGEGSGSGTTDSSGSGSGEGSGSGTTDSSGSGSGDGSGSGGTESSGSGSGEGTGSGTTDSSGSGSGEGSGSGTTDSSGSDSGDGSGSGGTESSGSGSGDGSGSGTTDSSGSGSGEGSDSGSGSSTSSGTPPTIMIFGWSKDGNWLRFSGIVSDDEDPSGLTVTFGGLLDGNSSVVLEDNSFVFVIQVSGEIEGSVTAQVTDSGGLASAVVATFV